jgi:hypothetical protein
LVFINRHTSGRSRWLPYGNTLHAYVRSGNLFLSRVALLCIIAVAKGCWWFVENPTSSLLPAHPRMLELFAYVEVGACTLQSVVLCCPCFVGLQADCLPGQLRGPDDKATLLLELFKICSAAVAAPFEVAP